MRGTLTRNTGEYLRYLIELEFNKQLEEATENAARQMADVIRARFTKVINQEMSMMDSAMLVNIRLDHNFEEAINDLERRVSELAEQNAEQAWLLSGECPECKRFIRGWKAPVGAFAPEAWATLREKGIDPSTGHLEACRRKALKIGGANQQNNHREERR